MSDPLKESLEIPEWSVLVTLQERAWALVRELAAPFPDDGYSDDKHLSWLRVQASQLLDDVKARSNKNASTG